MNIALSIAGSDSGGGAGIQADLKTFEAHGVFGLTAITCVTAQNTREVRSIYALPAYVLQAQIEVLLDDFAIDVIKIGLIPSLELLEVVATTLDGVRIPIILDTILKASTGDIMMGAGTMDGLINRLIPMAALVTPNIPEAETITGGKIVTLDDMQRAARHVVFMGAAAALVKGGHSKRMQANGARAIDVLFDGREIHHIESEFIESTSTHGTGCTLSAAIAANLANGADMVSAVKSAKHYVLEAIRHAPDIGYGNGPLLHASKTLPHS